jgi:hypothetical protein
MIAASRSRVISTIQSRGRRRARRSLRDRRRQIQTLLQLWHTGHKRCVTSRRPHGKLDPLKTATAKPTGSSCRATRGPRVKTTSDHAFVARHRRTHVAAQSMSAREMGWTSWCPFSLGGSRQLNKACTTTHQPRTGVQYPQRLDRRKPNHQHSRLDVASASHLTSGEYLNGYPPSSNCSGRVARPVGSSSDRSCRRYRRPIPGSAEVRGHRRPNV